MAVPLLPRGSRWRDRRSARRARLAFCSTSSSSWPSVRPSSVSAKRAAASRCWRMKRWAVVSASARARWARPASGKACQARRVPSRWFGASGWSRRDSSRVQAKRWASSGSHSARSASARQKPRSNAALWATSGVPCVKRSSSCMTARAGGARSSMALLMPVSCSMNGGTQAPLRIRLWNRPTISPPWTSTAATSVARAPMRRRHAGGLEIDDGDGFQGGQRCGSDEPDCGASKCTLYDKMYVRTACRSRGSQYWPESRRRGKRQVVDGQDALVTGRMESSEPRP